MNLMETLSDLSGHLILLQAGGSPGRPQQDWGQFIAQIFPMLIIIFVFMYLFAIRPQRKQEEQKRKMLEAVKKNDRVVTVGGVHGSVSAVKAETVILTVADNVQMKFSKSSIQKVLRKGEPEEQE